MSGEGLGDALEDWRKRRDAGAVEERRAVLKWLTEHRLSYALLAKEAAARGNFQGAADLSTTAEALRWAHDAFERGEHRSKGDG